MRIPTMAAGCFIVALGIASATDRAQAASELVEAVQVHLYAGETAAAVTAAEQRMAVNSQDDEARYALGAIQFLQAIENLGHAFHRYGLNSAESSVGGLAGLPLFRLPVPPNPNPDKIDYESLRNVLSRFVDDLAKAEKTLSEIDSATLDFPINIGLVRLDLDGDGRGSDEEALGQILIAIGIALDAENAGPVLIDSMRATSPGSAPTATCSWRSPSFRSRTIGELPSRPRSRGSFRARAYP